MEKHSIIRGLDNLHGAGGRGMSLLPVEVGSQPQPLRYNHAGCMVVQVKPGHRMQTAPTALRNEPAMGLEGVCARALDRCFA